MSAEASAVTGGRRHALQGTKRLLRILLAMAGVRLDRPMTIPLAGASYAVAGLIASSGDASLILGYFTAAWLFMYVGNGLALHATGAMDVEARERWVPVYETLLAFAFVNQGASLACLQNVPGSLLPFLEAPVLVALGVGLSVIGLGIKVWATWLVGVDTYYYRDLFLRRPSADFVARGPYRFLDNPMYGLGYMQAYGLALFVGSGPLFIGAAAQQLGVFGFHALTERPFVRAAYMSREPARSPAY